MPEYSVEERLKEFETLCRARGMPLTVQRRYVLRAVFEHEGHPTADQVYEVVREAIPGISRTTVYRVLDALVDLEVIRRVHHPGASARFDGKTFRHHHLICRKCNCVIDVVSPTLDALSLPPKLRQGFDIEDYCVSFTGVCARCSAKAPQ